MTRTLRYVNSERNALKLAAARLRRSRELYAYSLGELLDLLVPDGSHSALARKLGVSRQTIYDWKSGKSRPNKIKARLLAQLTGIPAEEIRP